MTVDSMYSRNDAVRVGLAAWSRATTALAAVSMALATGCPSDPSGDDPPDASSNPSIDAPGPDIDAGAQPDAAARPPLYSHAHGFYTDSFELTLTAPYEFVEVFYTLDGRDPAGPTASLYTQPLEIDTTTVIRVALMVDGNLTERTTTRSYIFPAHIPMQTAPAEYPSLWWSNDETGPWPADYEIDPQIVEDPRSASQFPGTFTALPAVSLALDPDDLFGTQGIHENADFSGLDWERPGSMEYFEIGDPNTIQINCGISVHGRSSRDPEKSPKKSFRVEFKAIYGPTELAFPMFEGSPVNEFDALVLRGGYNRSWAHYLAVQRTRAAYIREQYGERSQRAMGHLATRTKHAHLFLNGLYWGLIYIQERPDAAFQSSHLGGSKSDYDVLNSGEIVDGDRGAWDQMMALIDAPEGVVSSENYAALQDWLDLENFTDYMILNHYGGNLDWPDRNWYTGRRRSLEGRFRFYNWDAELILGNSTSDVIDRDYPDSPGAIFQGLIENPEYVVYLGDRIHKHLFNDGVFTPQASAARWAAISDTVEPAIFAETARWGDHWRDERMAVDGELYTHADFWLPEKDRVLGFLLPIRTGIVIEQYRSRGLYPSVAAPVASRHGGVVPAGFSLMLTASSGDIYYTLDGSDPRLEGGALSPSAVLYTGPISIDAAVTVRTRTRDGGAMWSAATEAVFTLE